MSGSLSENENSASSLLFLFFVGCADVVIFERGFVEMQGHYIFFYITKKNPLTLIVYMIH